MPPSQGKLRSLLGLSLLRVLVVMSGALALAPLLMVMAVRAQSSAIDPGVRGGLAAAGSSFPACTSKQSTACLTAGQTAEFKSGQQNFIEINGVPSIGPQGGATNETGNFGLGPRFDLLVHHTGSCLADGITNGRAAGDTFRTPPLWGIGQRIFFMHDWRTSDIVQAIEDHSDSFCAGSGVGGPYPLSEADGGQRL